MLLVILLTCVVLWDCVECVWLVVLVAAVSWLASDLRASVRAVVIRLPVLSVVVTLVSWSDLVMSCVCLVLQVEI